MELRTLEICVNMEIDEGTGKALMESLCALHKIQNLMIESLSPNRMSYWEGWVQWEPPTTASPIQFAEHPASSAAGVGELRVHPSPIPPGTSSVGHGSTGHGHDCEATGAPLPPTVHHLEILMDRRWCRTFSEPEIPQYINMALTFLQGAMPILTEARFRPRASADGGAGDVGFGEPPSAQQRQGATARQVKEAEAAWRHAVHAHPSHPAIHVFHFGEVTDRSYSFSVSILH